MTPPSTNIPSPRLRVLRVIARMNIGGPALQVAGLMRLQDPQIIQKLVTGFVPAHEADHLLLRDPSLEAIRIHSFGPQVRPCNDLRSLRALIRICQDFKPHVVHTHTFKAGLLGRLAAEIAGVPYRVHTFHGHLLHSYFSSRPTALIIRTEALLARRTDRICAVGANVRDELLLAGIGQHTQYRVVYPGVPCPELLSPREARRELALSEDSVVVAFAGRIDPVKRPDRLMRVAEFLLAKYSGVTIVIAGGGSQFNNVRTWAARFSPRVRLLGWADNPGTLWSASDIALLTSDNEGVPVSLIEAQMAGVPVVATDVGSTSEVVEHAVTGLLTPPHACALAEAASGLVADPALRARYSAAAYSRARTRFTVPRLQRETAALYTELCS